MNFRSLINFDFDRQRFTFDGCDILLTHKLDVYAAHILCLKMMQTHAQRQFVNTPD